MPTMNAFREKLVSAKPKPKQRGNPFIFDYPPGTLLSASAPQRAMKNAGYLGFGGIGKMFIRINPNTISGNPLNTNPFSKVV